MQSQHLFRGSLVNHHNTRETGQRHVPTNGTGRVGPCDTVPDSSPVCSLSTRFPLSRILRAPNKTPFLWESTSCNPMPDFKNMIGNPNSRVVGWVHCFQW